MSVTVARKALICDVDGTLYRQGPVRRQMAMQLASFCLASPLLGWKTMQTLRVYRRAQEHLRMRKNADARTQEEWTAGQLGYPASWVGECVREWMDIRPLPAVACARFPGLMETLEWAKTSNIALGVLSDYAPEGKLRAMGIDRFFSVAVSAQDKAVQRFKPDPRGLQVVLERLQVAPEQAVYIGDRLDVDYPVAACLGVPCCIIGENHKAMKQKGLTILPSWDRVLEWLKTSATIG